MNNPAIKTRAVGPTEIQSESCHYCKKVKPIFKYGGKSEPICEECAMGGPIELRHVVPLQGRNELCNCGSGKKYKKCCLRRN